MIDNTVYHSYEDFRNYKGYKMILFLILWFITGLIGSSIAHINLKLFERKLYQDNRTFCPSPKELLGVIFGSILGIISLLAGLLIFIIDTAVPHFYKKYTTSKFKTWFNKPICKEK